MEYNALLNEAKGKRKEIKQFFEKLKKRPPAQLDATIHDAHEQAFACIDCLKCAQCCTTTGPLFTNKDIERIAAHVRLKPGQFIETYLRIDEDGDYVLQKVPCAFLGPDNYCSIYDVRPKACREYPHTDRDKQAQILHLTEKNALICPAVYTIFQKLQTIKW